MQETPEHRCISVVKLSLDAGFVHASTRSKAILVGAGRYIDAWSSRSTWGGGYPPTGCGDYVLDRACTDTVVIPEGQTVLLDVSPPRLYLILIEGTLIFDRRDLLLQARTHSDVYAIRTI